MSNAKLLNKQHASRPLKLQVVINGDVMHLSSDHAARSSMKSVSQLALSKDHKPPAEGLRRLMSGCRSSARGKAEIEKYRSPLRSEKRALTDPRFRRQRTRSPKKAIYSQSEAQILPSDTYVEQNNTHSDPAFASKHQKEEKEEKPTVVVVAAADKKDDRSAVLTIEQGTSTIDHAPNDDYRSAALKVDVAQQISEEAYGSSGNSQTKKVETGVDEASAQHSNSGSAKRRKYWTNKSVVKTDYVNKSPYWDDPRLLKKYANLLSMSHGVKKSKSSVTLPVVLSKVPDNLCMCLKCSCVKHCPESYNFENTEVEGSNYFDGQYAFKEYLVGSYSMLLLYTFGCLCGITLVALLAWVLSNDVIWSWVNHRKDFPKKSNIVYPFLSYLGGMVFYTLNFILGGIYNVFVLPRNAIFKDFNEPPLSVWNVFEQ